MAGRRIGAGAAATSLAAFIAACGSSSSSSSSAAGGSSSATSSSAAAGTGTASSSRSASGSPATCAIVNYALTLEYLEAQFYAKVIKSGLFSGKNLSVIKTFGAEEAEHVAALHKVAMSLGTPGRQADGQVPAQERHAGGQARRRGREPRRGRLPRPGRNIQSKEILAAALAIHSIEARHAATLNLVLKKDPTPEGAFAKPMTMAEVLKVVKPFIA